MTAPGVIDADTVSGAARLAGIAVAGEDLDLLTRTMSRYAEVVAPLRDADLGDTQTPAVLDPRDGW